MESLRTTASSAIRVRVIVPLECFTERNTELEKTAQER